MGVFSHFFRGYRFAFIRNGVPFFDQKEKTMSIPYYKTSPITGKTYNLFDMVQILNIQQVCYYIKNKIPVEDIEVTEDRGGKPRLVFLFSKKNSYMAYEEWKKMRFINDENNRDRSGDAENWCRRP